MHKATTITHWTYCVARDWHCVQSAEMRDGGIQECDTEPL